MYHLQYEASIQFIGRKTWYGCNIDQSSDTDDLRILIGASISMTRLASEGQDSVL